MPSQSSSNNGTSQEGSLNSTQENSQKEPVDPSTALIPVRHYLTLGEQNHFVWDDVNKETSDKWLRSVQEAGLDPTKHKVFHHANRDFLIPGTHPFQNLGDLGQSGSNIVYKVNAPPAQALLHKRPLALKVILCTEKSRPGGPRSRARKQALEEVRNMANIRHSHIVVYVASFEDYCIQSTRSKRIKDGKRIVTVEEEIRKHILGIAMYPPARYNLRELMERISNSHNHNEKRKAMRNMHGYFGCLSQAVTYLHKSDVQIRHKDIKPANIVIDENGIPLLTDFGLSKHFEVGKDSDGPTAKTVKYAEPEAVREMGRNMRSDIFPLGCVFLEMATVLLGLAPAYAEQRLSGGAIARFGGFQYSDESSLRRLPAYLAELEAVASELVRSEQGKGKENVNMMTGASTEAGGGKERSARAIIQILPVIAQMMEESIVKRPYAKELFPRFRHLYEVYPDLGFCKSCEEEILTGGSFPLKPTESMLALRGRGPVTRSSTLLSMASIGSSGLDSMQLDGPSLFMTRRAVHLSA
ncbi:Protein kinase-like domain containing protein [Naviculisporaceae sp. PSN 640]